MESGQQVLFLDLRERVPPRMGHRNRASMIEEAKRLFTADCQKLLDAASEPRPGTSGEEEDLSLPLADCYDCCAAAYFYHVLGRSLVDSQGTRESTFVPLYMAIEQAKLNVAGGRGEAERPDGSSAPPPTKEQLEKLSWWLACKFSEDAFEVYFDRCVIKNENLRKAALITYGHYDYAEGPKSKLVKEKDSECDRSKGEITVNDLKPSVRREFMKRQMSGNASAMATHLLALFSSDNFHGCNVKDLSTAQRLVHALVKNERLPKRTSLEGLELLQQAWNEHDVASHLAGYYTVCSHAFYMCYLLLGVATVVFTVMHSEGFDGDGQGAGTFEHLIFALSLASSMVLSLQGGPSLNPNPDPNPNPNPKPNPNPNPNPNPSYDLFAPRLHESDGACQPAALIGRFTRVNHMALPDICGRVPAVRADAQQQIGEESDARSQQLARKPDRWHRPAGDRSQQALPETSL